MLTASISIAIAATLSLQRDLSKSTDPLSLTIAQAIADGSGINQSNRIFSDTITIASGANAVLDLFDFSNAPDSVGQLYALSRVTAVLIRNKNTTAGNILRVGGEGSAAAWNSPFSASDTATLDIAAGGTLLLIAPSVAGYAVADATNHLLKILNAGTGAIDLDIVIIGS